MNNARIYDLHGLPVQELANQVAGWFQTQEYQINYRTDPYGRTIVQVYKSGFWRTAFGFRMALTTVFTPQNDGRVVVELGGETWDDKLVVGAVGFLLLPPLLLTAALGAWQQSDLDEQVWRLLADHIFSRTGQNPNPVVAVPYGYGYSSVGGYSPPPDQQYQGYYSSGYGPQTADYAPPTSAGWPTANQLAPAQKLSWFEADSAQPIFSNGFTKMSTWQRAMADGKIVNDEVNEQSGIVDKLYREAESKLELDQKIKFSEVITAMERLEQMQQSEVNNPGTV
jgi:hypothetical protein